MPDYSDLRRFADAALVEQGKRLLEGNALVVSSSEQEEDGFLRLRGRSTDAFHFVDHPSLLLGPDGKVRDYRCDCGEGRRGNFCVHCAALALKAAEDRPKPAMHIAAAAPVMKAGKPAQGEILQYSFSFGNNEEGLYHGQEPAFLSEKNFIAMYEDNEWEQELFEEEELFGGICYGMAAANSIFNWPGDDVLPSAFRWDANLPYDLPLESFNREWSMALLDYLEMLYISQFHPVAKMLFRGDWYEPADTIFRELIQQIESYRAGDHPLCVLGITKSISKELERKGEKGGGHALLPYRVDTDEKGPRRLALYDCNFPGEERYMELLRDPAGKITGWRYDMGSLGIWGEDRKGCEHHVSYSEHDVIQALFSTRPNPVPDDFILLRTKNENLTLRNRENVPVLQITDTGSYKTDSKDVVITYPLSMKRNRPMVHLPAGKYSVDARDGEFTEITLRFTARNRSAEIRTDADEFTVEVDETGQICAVEIPVAERTYYVTLRSTDPQDQKEVRLEGITGYECLRFGQIRHGLYVEGISERTQQDLYLDGQEASLELLTRGFPQKEERKEEKKEREILYNTSADANPQGEDR